MNILKVIYNCSTLYTVTYMNLAVRTQVQTSYHYGRRAHLYNMHCSPWPHKLTDSWHPPHRAPPSHNPKWASTAVWRAVHQGTYGRWRASGWCGAHRCGARVGSWANVLGEWSLVTRQGIAGSPREIDPLAAHSSLSQEHPAHWIRIKTRDSETWHRILPWALQNKQRAQLPCAYNYYIETICQCICNSSRHPRPEDLSLPHVFLGNTQESVEFVKSISHSAESWAPQIWLGHLPNYQGISTSFHKHSLRVVKKFHSMEWFSRNP